MIIYLTGVPASGKTTLCERLNETIPNIMHFRFGRALTTFLQGEHQVTQEDLRQSTAHLSSPDIVNTINEQAIKYCRDHKVRSHVIIDTHAVTTEDTGFRMTPMSLAQIERMAPDMLVCLTVQPEIAQERVEAAAQGRPALSEEQLRLQASLQSSLITAYSAMTGCPAYFFKNETECDRLKIEAELSAMIEAA